MIGLSPHSFRANPSVTIEIDSHGKQLDPLRAQAAEDAMRAAAHDFEAAFLTQMLTFSGLGDALTLGGGEASSAFAGFYIESLAEKMTEAGGLGLADRFYVELQQLNSLKNKEDGYDDLGKL